MTKFHGQVMDDHFLWEMLTSIFQNLIYKSYLAVTSSLILYAPK